MAKLWIVSLYALGEKRASDCLPDFYASREIAKHAAETAMADARDARESSDRTTARVIGWPVRYTIRYCIVSQRDAANVAKYQ